MVRVGRTRGGFVDIQVKGVAQTMNFLRAKNVFVSDGADLGALQGANLLGQEVQESIIGKRDEPKSVDTGKFANSIEVDKVAKATYKVSTDIPYSCVINSTTSIITKDGIKGIGGIKVGEEVLTQDGNYHKVIKTHKFQAYLKPKLIDIETEYRKDRIHKLTLTQDHKILIMNENNCLYWKEAGNLDYSDRVLTKIKIPNNKGKKLAKRINIDCDYCKIDFEILENEYNKYRKNNIHNYCSLKCRVDDWKYNKNNHHIGMKRTIETRNLLRKITKNRLDKNPESHPNRIMNKKGHQTKIEKQVEEWVKTKYSIYKKQFNIGRFYVDFYIPQFNTIIECDGAYWHKEQIKDIERDSKLLKLIPNVKIIHLHFVDKRFSKNIDSNPLPNVQYVQCNPSLKSYADLKQFKPTKILNLKKYIYKRPYRHSGKYLYDLTVDGCQSYTASSILISNSFLEFGTSRIPARGHFGNSLERNRKEIRAAIDNAIAIKLRKNVAGVSRTISSIRRFL